VLQAGDWAAKCASSCGRRAADSSTEQDAKDAAEQDRQIARLKNKSPTPKKIWTSPSGSSRLIKIRISRIRIIRTTWRAKPNFKMRSSRSIPKAAGYRAPKTKLAAQEETKEPSQAHANPSCSAANTDAPAPRRNPSQGKSTSLSRRTTSARAPAQSVLWIPDNHHFSVRACRQFFLWLRCLSTPTTAR